MEEFEPWSEEMDENAAGRRGMGDGWKETETDGGNAKEETEEEKALAAQLKTGDERALQTFYEEYFAVFVAFAHQLTGDEEEGKDVVQDVFLAYWNARREFDSLVAIRAFFYRSIRRKCLNIIRHGMVKARYAEECLAKAESDVYVEEKIVEQEMLHVIYREIGRLTPAEQQVLMLALDGKSNGEIAEELGVTLATVKSHKAKSYEILRRRLKYLRVLLMMSLSL